LRIILWYGYLSINTPLSNFVNFGTDIQDTLNKWIGSDYTNKQYDAILKIKDAIIIDCRNGLSNYTCGRAVETFTDKDSIDHILIYNTISKDNDLMDDEYIGIAKKKYDASLIGGYYQKYLKYKQKYLNLKKLNYN
jgi:hypothetical protein